MPAEPPRDCQLCPRLAEFRAANGAAFPGWFNAPVPGFGPREARLLVVGLAPGLRGANRTGRPFTGDFAGKLLYGTLLKFGLASGVYAERADDGLELLDCRIVNAVRCVPPENRPLPAEISACNPFLKDEIAAMTRLRGILALGGVAHQATLRAFGLRASHARFGHGAMIELPGGIALADSFHVSRLNTNTGRLTAAMFESVVGTLLARIAG
ncbi:uracil-DNA glycosylase [Acidiphilium sp. C61]|jgi:uracil-DNA glycosylase family 4|uniref:uracil-DNA glycosylase n=1 Tax=Acidiphilium sp. C61 TaxID=1671485 RepID=UPI00157AB532|nr:uracil-DNA glycosylase [Acidiphilium sp. C61]